MNILFGTDIKIWLLISIAWFFVVFLFSKNFAKIHQKFDNKLYNANLSCSFYYQMYKYI